MRDSGPSPALQTMAALFNMTPPSTAPTQCAAASALSSRKGGNAMQLSSFGEVPFELVPPPNQVQQQLPQQHLRQQDAAHEPLTGLQIRASFGPRLSTYSFPVKHEQRHRCTQQLPGHRRDDEVVCCYFGGADPDAKPNVLQVFRVLEQRSTSTRGHNSSVSRKTTGKVLLSGSLVEQPTQRAQQRTFVQVSFHPFCDYAVTLLTHEALPETAITPATAATPTKPTACSTHAVVRLFDVSSSTQIPQQEILLPPIADSGLLASHFSFGAAAERIDLWTALALFVSFPRITGSCLCLTPFLPNRAELPPALVLQLQDASLHYQVVQQMCIGQEGSSSNTQVGESCGVRTDMQQEVFTWLKDRARGSSTTETSSMQQELQAEPVQLEIPRPSEDISDELQQGELLIGASPLLLLLRWSGGVQATQLDTGAFRVEVSGILPIVPQQQLHNGNGVTLHCSSLTEAGLSGFRCLPVVPSPVSSPNLLLAVAYAEGKATTVSAGAAPQSEPAATRLPLLFALDLDAAAPIPAPKHSLNGNRTTGARQQLQLEQDQKCEIHLQAAEAVRAAYRQQRQALDELRRMRVAASKAAASAEAESAGSSSRKARRAAAAAAAEAAVAAVKWVDIAESVFLHEERQQLRLLQHQAWRMLQRKTAILQHQLLLQADEAERMDLQQQLQQQRISELERQSDELKRRCDSVATLLGATAASLRRQQLALTVPQHGLLLQLLPSQLFSRIDAAVMQRDAETKNTAHPTDVSSLLRLTAAVTAQMLVIQQRQQELQQEFFLTTASERSSLEQSSSTT
ncbi:armadillo beta-catenin-like repeat-containing protein [Cyclospora cayetanensis]|uniref:Armadillo beta-catenin-like repeat-containing protein n=1 Tax=Cyclospora cayetanensis TaxID=88456 RepID=A0A1D3D3F9_9EIME|nr:armadillo beta-catenin-like repeat-containing protein [Cyclospora cayetanensis]